MLADLIPAKGAARRLGVLTLVQAAGTGLFLTSSAVFFVQVVGLRPREVGIGLSLAGLCGFLTTVPVGRLADRYGARRLLAVNYAVLVPLFALYPFVRSFVPFVVAASLISVAESSASPLRSAVIHAMFGAKDAVQTRAQLRGVFNVGFMLGAAAAGLAVAAASDTTFRVISVANAIAQGVCVVIVVRLRGPGLDAGRGFTRDGVGSAVRDLRFVLITLGNGLLELHTTVLTLGIPLWIVSHTEAPASLNSGLIITNTVIVLLLQVRLSRGSETVAGAARLQRRAGVLLALGCAVCAASDGTGAVLSALTILVGTVLLTFGELCQAAGAWGLSFELPPQGRQGEYQGVFALGRGVQQFVGPALVTALVAGVGSAGWLVLAALFLAVGFGCLRLVTGFWQRRAAHRAGVRRRHIGRHRHSRRPGLSGYNLR